MYRYVMYTGITLRSGFFLFKHETAYEVRISDWSSDVCSSDLVALRREFKGHLIHQPDRVLNGAVHACFDDPCRNPDSAICFLDCISGMGKSLEGRSEERRVGKECVSTC